MSAHEKPRQPHDAALRFLTTHDQAWIEKMAMTSPHSRETLTKALATAADATGWETSEIRRLVEANPQIPAIDAIDILRRAAPPLTLFPKEIKCAIYPETIKRCGLLTGVTR